MLNIYSTLILTVLVAETKITIAFYSYFNIHLYITDELNGVKLLKELKSHSTTKVHLKKKMQKYHVFYIFFIFHNFMNLLCLYYYAFTQKCVF